MSNKFKLIRRPGMFLYRVVIVMLVTVKGLIKGS